MSEDSYFDSSEFSKLKSDISFVSSDSRSHRLLRDSKKVFVVVTALQYIKLPPEGDLARLKEIAKLSEDQNEKFDIQFLDINKVQNREMLNKLEAVLGAKEPFLIDDLQVAPGELGLRSSLDTVVLHRRSKSIVGFFNLSSVSNISEVLNAVADRKIAKKKVLPPSMVSADAPPGYSKDIAPILIRNCVGCHNTEGAAPWAMSSHASLLRWKKMIREVLLLKRMPPAQSDSYYGKYSNEIKPSAEDVRKIVSWIDAGAAKDSDQDPLKDWKPEPRADFRIGKPDLVIDIPELTMAPGETEKVLSLKMQWPLNYPVRVRGMDVQTDNVKATHHLSVYYLVPSAAKPGSFNVAMFDGGYIPGYEPRLLPMNSSYLIPANSPIRVSPHVVPTGKSEKVKMRIGYYLDKSVSPVELVHCGMDTHHIDIPPYAENFPVVAKGVTQQDIRIIQLGTHMHSRGKSIKYVAKKPDGSEVVLLSLPNYNRSWQREYIPEKPVFIPKGSTLTCSGIYDNSKNNPRIDNPGLRIKYGWYSDDEMLACSCFAMREGDYQKILGKKVSIKPIPPDSNRDIMTPLEN